MKCILTTTALILTSGFIFAAGAGAQETSPSSVFSWSGFYAGVHAGYAAGYSDLLIDGGGPIFNAQLEPSGFIGGVQMGFNQQMDNGFVLGAEADVTYNGVQGMVPIPAGNMEALSNIEWSGSARVRAGYALGGTMPYITGGVAAANYNVDLLSVPATVAAHRETHIGWTAGIGIEHAITGQWTARVEYRYSDFGEKTLSAAGGFLPGGNISLTTHDVRVGLNYRF